jgi:hypothetical protein
MMIEKDERIEYGKAHANFHVAGYAFERGCLDLEWLLEGDRWKLDGSFDDVNEFLKSLQLEKFITVAQERKRLALRIKQLQPEASNRAIAKALGASHQTIGRDVGPDGPSASQKANGNNEAASASGPNGPPRERSGAEAAQLVARKFRGTEGTGNNEWLTPLEYIELVRAALGGRDRSGSGLVRARSRDSQSAEIFRQGSRRIAAAMGRPPLSQSAIQAAADR